MNYPKKLSEMTTNHQPFEKKSSIMHENAHFFVRKRCENDLHFHEVTKKCFLHSKSMFFELIHDRVNILTMYIKIGWIKNNIGQKNVDCIGENNFSLILMFEVKTDYLKKDQNYSP